MKWPVVLVLAAAACQSGEAKEGSGQPATGVVGAPSGTPNTTVIQLPKAAVTEAYRADITTLCDVVHLSGADQKAPDERWPIIAMYLGPQIKTNEGHDFLVAIQPLQGEAKALALETEAKRVGLAKCDLANEWRPRH